MSETQNQTNGTDENFRLTRVWARNFKSIRELDLELGPLTVLVGPNASGKSNVLDVLSFIKKAIGARSRLGGRGAARDRTRSSERARGEVIEISSWALG